MANNYEYQQKPWDELTEEERQVIRESWKHELPEEYDVYFFNGLSIDEDLHIPGNLYIRGEVNCKDITVDGDLFIDGCIISGSIKVAGNFDCYFGYIYTTLGRIQVGGNFTSHSIINGCGDIDVSGNFTAYKAVNCHNIVARRNLLAFDSIGCNDIFVFGNGIIHGDIDCLTAIVVGDFIVDEFVNSHTVDVGGLFVCYDLISHGFKCHANDFVCLWFEETNT